MLKPLMHICTEVVTYFMWLVLQEYFSYRDLEVLDILFYFLANIMKLDQLVLLEVKTNYHLFPE